MSHMVSDGHGERDQLNGGILGRMVISPQRGGSPLRADNVAGRRARVRLGGMGLRADSVRAHVQPDSFENFTMEFT